MSYLTFDDVLEQIKAEGPQERQTIEAAEKVADIIEKVTKARIKKGMSQRELAEVSKVQQTTIARMETLKVIPRLNTLVRIAECLDIEISVEQRTLRVIKGGRFTSTTYNWDPLGPTRQYHLQEA